MKPNFLKPLFLFGVIAMTTSASWAAMPKCNSLFAESESTVTPSKVTLKYAAESEDVAMLYTMYPKYMETIEKTVKAIETASLNASVTPISKVSEMKQVRGASTGTDWGKPAKLDALPASLKKQIIDVHNAMVDKEAFKEYMIELMNDIGVLMMKEKDRETFGLSDFNQPTSARTQEKIRKEEYLLKGVPDRNSMLRVLVNRIRARGDNVTVILSAEKGGYQSNQTKTQKYSSFFKVPEAGPFFDLYFGAGSSHGQEGHLLQMDYAETVLKPTNRRQFWKYATSEPKGNWVWDTLFDGMNSTFMHPEFVGPILRKTLPLY